MKHKAGFTLVEVMVVVAIMGILAAIAVPSYVQYLQRGHRSDAKAMMMQVAQWQERFRTQNNVYATDAQLPTGLSSSPGGGAPTRYTLTVTNPDSANPAAPTTFLVTATRAGAQASDRCGDFTLSHTGQRGLVNNDSSATVAECWNR